MVPPQPVVARPKKMNTMNYRKTPMNYRTTPMSLMPNGLTLLQQNPDCAARLEPEARGHGWLYTRGADGQWVTMRKLSAAEIETAYDQAADMAVLQGTQVRTG